MKIGKAVAHVLYILFSYIQRHQINQISTNIHINKPHPLYKFCSLRIAAPGHTDICPDIDYIMLVFAMLKVVYRKYLCTIAKYTTIMERQFICNYLAQEVC